MALVLGPVMAAAADAERYGFPPFSPGTVPAEAAVVAGRRVYAVSRQRACLEEADTAASPPALRYCRETPLPQPPGWPLAWSVRDRLAVLLTGPYYCPAEMGEAEESRCGLADLGFMLVRRSLDNAAPAGPPPAASPRLGAPIDRDDQAIAYPVWPLLFRGECICPEDAAIRYEAPDEKWLARSYDLWLASTAEVLLFVRRFGSLFVLSYDPRRHASAPSVIRCSELGDEPWLRRDRLNWPTRQPFRVLPAGTANWWFLTADGLLYSTPRQGAEGREPICCWDAEGRPILATLIDNDTNRCYLIGESFYIELGDDMRFVHEPPVPWPQPAADAQPIDRLLVYYRRVRGLSGTKGDATL